MSIDAKLTPALECIGALKNLQLEQLIPLLQALHEKVKASNDFADADFVEGMLSDMLADAIYYAKKRDDAALLEMQEAEVAIDHKHGFDTYNGFSIPSFGY